MELFSNMRKCDIVDICLGNRNDGILLLNYLYMNGIIIMDFLYFNRQNADGTWDLQVEISGWGVSARSQRVERESQATQAGNHSCKFSSFSLLPAFV